MRVTERIRRRVRRRRMRTRSPEPQGRYQVIHAGYGLHDRVLAAKNDLGAALKRAETLSAANRVGMSVVGVVDSDDYERGWLSEADLYE